METFLSLVKLIVVDAIFVLLFVAAMALIAIFLRPAFAVLKRNFVSYFTNPIGYLFICLFVLLASIAAFWREDFFNANLANLDQLNEVIPWVLLIFVPAITMSIWADERRQSTDELLLTIPADDLEIVLGKYLAAVSIFTVSLLFSQVCNFIVLVILGNPDVGLFLGNYFGYWIVGLTMLSIGMVASFMTNNVTVAFALGTTFNFVLVFAAYLKPIWLIGGAISKLSIAAHFEDFQAGVISLSSLVYFGMLIVVMLYLCMVLIGRRHWSGGAGGNLLGLHYLARVAAMFVIVASLTALFNEYNRVRFDVTSERLSSLSPDTYDLIDETVARIRRSRAAWEEEQQGGASGDKNSDDKEKKKDLGSRFPVTIEAFVSKDLPEEFAVRRADLLNALREIRARGGDEIRVDIHRDIDLFSKEARLAKTTYGIEPETVDTKIRGASAQKEVIFGFAAKSGLEMVKVPFLGRGIPIEYELIRSICTVTETKRKRIGILATDVQLLSSGGIMGGGPREDQPLIDELRKQFDVVPVNANSQITDKLDCLLAAQPSSLSPEQMQHFVDYVKAGNPVAIFEDPFPIAYGNVPGTDQPKRPQGGMMGFRQPPQPKGDLKELWRELGVELEGVSGEGFPPKKEAVVIWQEYNPHPSDKVILGIRDEWVFVTPESRSSQPFHPQNPIVSGLQEVLFLFSGAWRDTGGVDRNYTELVRTSPLSGTVKYDDLLEMDFFQQMLRSEREVDKLRDYDDDEHVLAVLIESQSKKKSKNADKDKEGEDDEQEEDAAENAAESAGGLKVCLVADIDCLSGVFFFLRALGDDQMNPVTKWNMDNVAFVLNIIDYLAGDERFLEIRKRRPVHRELTAIRKVVDKAKEEQAEEREKASEELEKALEEEQKKFDKLSKDLTKRLRSGEVDRQKAQEQIDIALERARKNLEKRKAQLERDRDRQDELIENRAANEVKWVQDWYKAWAVLLPPIPPLIIAICVFIYRRVRESEGVATSRMV